MISGWGWLCGLVALTLVGLAGLLAVIGGILFLCESSWEKQPGALGSCGFFAGVGLLLLPVLAFVLYAWVR